jgi:hypothetical protein
MRVRSKGREVIRATGLIDGASASGGDGDQRRSAAIAVPSPGRLSRALPPPSGAVVDVVVGPPIVVADGVRITAAAPRLIRADAGISLSPSTDRAASAVVGSTPHTSTAARSISDTQVVTTPMSNVGWKTTQ